MHSLPTKKAAKRKNIVMSAQQATQETCYLFSDLT